jgi:hypothetical protein
MNRITTVAGLTAFLFFIVVPALGLSSEPTPTVPTTAPRSDPHLIPPKGGRRPPKSGGRRSRSG